MLIGVVGVGAHGTKKLNDDLRVRFGVATEAFPVYKLFMRGKPEEEPIPYLGEINALEILKFVTEHTNIRVSLPGSLKDFDLLAEKFMASDSNQKLMIRREAMTKSTTLTQKEEQEKSKYYILVMKKVMERGDEFVGTEMARLTKILASGSLNKEKQNLFKQRLNILPSFQVAKTYKEL